MNAHLVSSLPPTKREVLNSPWKLNCTSVQSTVILLGTTFQRLEVLGKLYFSEQVLCQNESIVSQFYNRRDSGSKMQEGHLGLFRDD